MHIDIKVLEFQDQLQGLIYLLILHYQVFSAFGRVQKIAIFEKNGGFQALIQYPGNAMKFRRYLVALKESQSQICIMLFLHKDLEWSLVVVSQFISSLKNWIHKYWFFGLEMSSQFLIELDKQ